MSIRQYIRNKIFLFSFFLAIGMIFFMSQKANASHQNAAIICLIDDMSFSYKTQVFYTGEEIERGRISQFLYNDLQMVDTISNRMQVMSLVSQTGTNAKGENWGTKSDYPKYTVEVSNDVQGSIQIYYTEDKNTLKPIRSVFDTTKKTEEKTYNEDSKHLTAPLTFPCNPKKDATAADINRAYEIAEVLGNGFNDALTFINGGESYTSVQQLMSAAYGLCIIQDGKNMVGPSNTGNSSRHYTLKHNTTASDDNGYLYKCTITNTDQTYSNYAPASARDTSKLTKKVDSFPYAVKKGYKGCNYHDSMEDGTFNNLADTYDDAYADTTYITWEHLFLQAGMYYAEGVTYANSADLYSVSAMESALTKFFSGILDALSNYINTYTMEDLIFNNGVRGSRAYYFGAFSNGWVSYMLNMFLIFVAIAVSLVFFIVVRIILKRQLATANVFERASIMEGIKNVLISLFFVAFVWGLIRILMLLNFKFVSIWGILIGDRTLNTINASGVIMGGVVLKFIYFILKIYINYIYIIRGLVIPALIITSPLFIIALNFGYKGKEIFTAWLKELVGSIFMQSFHAFVYGLIIVASVGVRGIESIVIMASIIPLTNMFKEMTGSGGDAIIRTANSLTQTTGQITGQLAGTAGKAIGQLAGDVATPALKLAGAGIGAIAGNPEKGAQVGESIGNTIGGFAKDAGKLMGGITQAGVGIGLDASQVGGGSSLTSGGLRQSEEAVASAYGRAKDILPGNSVSGISSGTSPAGGGGGAPIGGDGGSGNTGGSGGMGSALTIDSLLDGSLATSNVSSGIDMAQSKEKAPKSPNGSSLSATFKSTTTSPGGVEVASVNPIQEMDRLKAAMNDFGSQANIKSLGNKNLNMSYGTDESGRRYIERTYSQAGGQNYFNMRDGSPEQNLHKTLADYEINVANGRDREREYSRFCKKYSADAAYVTRTQNESGQTDRTITFRKYIDPAPSGPQTSPNV